MEIGKQYGLAADTIDRLPQMDAQMMARVFPVIMRAVLGNTFQLRMLMAAEFQTFTADENLPIIKMGFQAGRAYANEAATLRAAHQEDASNPTPEAKLGPACVQVFLAVCDQITKEGDKVGGRNKTAWEAQKARIDGITDSTEMAMLVKGFRVSSAFKTGQCKLAVAIADATIMKSFTDCVVQLGAEHRQGIAPRSNVERILQMAVDEFEDGL